MQGESIGKIPLLHAGNKVSLHKYLLSWYT
jgi:hypothetical protein